MNLERVEGPECRRCGCMDSEVVRAWSRWGKPYERRQCEHCGHTFSAAAVSNGQDEPVEESPARPRHVVFHHGRTRCPQCRSPSTLVTSTRIPIRHHKCRGCGHCFKSVE